MKFKKLMATVAVGMLATTAAHAADGVKIGILLGFTGPIASTVANMGPAAELAIKEVNDSHALLGGVNVAAVRGDDTCTDSSAATAAAERLITSDHVDGIVGGDCSGVTGAVLQNVARPNGIVMISPSATSPALSSAPDDGLFFRTSPSDARQGQIVAQVLKETGTKSIAISYTNNDYGKGLADAIDSSFKKVGGTVTINAPHEDGKGDYTAEVGALAAAGGDVLVVAGYIDQGGRGIVQAALDTGAFSKFYFPDGMASDKLNEYFGKSIDGSYGDIPGTDSPGNATFKKMVTTAGFTPGSYTAESYDAAALIMLAMEAANSKDPAKYKTKIMDVANAPGIKIYPGQLGKALKLIKEGKDIDYVGASSVELIGPGESAGSYREIVMKDGKVTTVKYR